MHQEHITGLVQETFQVVTDAVVFSPSSSARRQSLILLACVGAVGLGLSLLVLAVYLLCLCGCRRDVDDDSKRPKSRCITWVAVITGLTIW